MDILKVLARLIEGYTNKEYGKAVEKATFAAQVFAHKAEEQPILEYRLSESEAQKKQRLRVTHPITCAAVSPALEYVSEIQRTDGVTRSHNFTSPKVESIEGQFASFYAGQSMQEYIFKAVKLANEMDPNAWLLLEREETESGFLFYPVIIPSKRAIDWAYDRWGKLQYLAFYEDKVFVRKADKKNPETRENVKDFYIYAKGLALVAYYIGVHKQRLHEIEIPEGSEPFLIGDYMAVLYDTGTQEAPAVCLGAYESGIEPGMHRELIYEMATGFLQDLMIGKSGYDINKLLHAFPKLVQYEKICDYVDDDGYSCERGFINGKVCKSCKGTGKVHHGSESDMISIPYPDSVDKFVDLGQFAHYITPPLGILEFQKIELMDIQKMMTFIIYASEQYQRIQPGVTATEIAVNYSRIYNKLKPIADKIAEIEGFVWRVALQYYDEWKPGENFVVNFPFDFGMKTEAELLQDLGEAKRVTASAGIIRSIELEIIKKRYRNSPEIVADEVAFARHQPFADKSEQFTAMIISSRSPDNFERVLWENFGQIKAEIQDRFGVGSFAKLGRDRQKELIKDEADKYILVEEEPGAVPPNPDDE